MVRPRRPPLTVDQVRYLRQHRKWVASDWVDVVLASLTPSAEGNRRGAYHVVQVNAPALKLQGDVWVRLRQAVSRPDDDYSAMVAFVDHDGVTYNVVRCNGPCHPHTNRLDGRTLEGWHGLGVTPHVHYLTAAATRSRSGRPLEPENQAYGCMPWGSLREAVIHAGRRANLRMRTPSLEGDPTEHRRGLP